MPVYNFSSNPLYVDEGQSIQFRYEAPPDFDATTVVTIQVGEYQTLWVIKTKAEDFAPDDFTLLDFSPAEKNRYYTYAETSDSPNSPNTGNPAGGGASSPPERSGETVIEIDGLSVGTQAPFSVSSNVVDAADYGWRIRVGGTGSWGAFTDGTYYNQASPPQITVSNGDQIQVYVKSSENAVDEKFVIVNVGFGSAKWRVTTGPDLPNIPNPLPVFNNLEDLEFNVVVYSNIVQITGLSTDATISVSGAASQVLVSNNNTNTAIVDGYTVLQGGTGWAASQTIQNNQYVQLRGTTANIQQSLRTIGVGIGSEPNAATWTIKTGDGEDTTPGTINFQNQSGIIPGTQNIYSNSQEITGVTPGLPIPIVKGTVFPSDAVANPRLSINGGSPGPINGSTVVLGDEIQLVVDSSPDLLDTNTAPPGGTVSVQIDVGNVSVSAWQVANWTGPDTDPSFTPLSNTTGWTPGGNAVVGPVGLTDFNQAITATATATDSLGGSPTVFISVDSGPFTASPVTIQPNNTGTPILVRFRVAQPGDISTDPATGLGATSTITYSFGDSGDFTVIQTNYLVVPIPPAFQGCWYSNKNEYFDQAGWEAAGSPAANALSYYRAAKQDGYSIGTVVPITKEFDGTYGNIEERFPGFVKCEGQSLDKNEYPFLFEAIGYHYGGSGNNFNVPDYRNRRLVGDSQVDGNAGSSAAVECTYGPTGVAGAGNYAIPGCFGGWWFMAQVDADGPDPLEQVIGTGNEGTQSLFFNLGTVKTFGLDTTEADVPFTITGTAQGTLGVVSPVTPSVPQHEHLVATAITESDAGDPLIPWGEYAYYRTQTSGQGKTPKGEDEPDSDKVYQWWQQYGFGTTTASEFDDEIQNTDPDSSLKDILPLGDNGGPATETFGNYWGSSMSPINSLSPTSAYYNGVSGGANFPTTIGGTSNATDAGVIDTTEDFAKVDRYTSIYSNGTSHSHFLSETNPVDPQTDFSFGNTIGAGDGTSNAGFAAAFADFHTITFFQSGGPAGTEPVALELNEAEFTWNNANKPIPLVSMDPQNNVANPTPFYKVKYIIKAY